MANSSAKLNHNQHSERLRVASGLHAQLTVTSDLSSSSCLSLRCSSISSLSSLSFLQKKERKKYIHFTSMLQTKRCTKWFDNMNANISNKCKFHNLCQWWSTDGHQKKHHTLVKITVIKTVLTTIHFLLKLLIPRLIFPPLLLLLCRVL